MPYFRRDKTFLIPMTLSLAATAWCEHHAEETHPEFISSVLLSLAKMKVKPIELIQFFDRHFSDQIALFSDDVRQ